MCGRYSLFTSEEEQEIREIIAEVSRMHPNAELKTGEIFPTNTAPVLIGGASRLEPEPLVWGFPNFRNKGIIINARAETAEQKNMFRESLLGRRCVIPSTGFYEWKQGAAKQKYLFRNPESRVTWLAGFYNEIGGERRYVILTTAPNESIRDIHSRMPVVLSKERLEDWVFRVDDAMEILRKVPPLLEKEVVG